MTEIQQARSTPEEARRRADRIRGHIASAWEEVITAFKHLDHEALGYGTGQAGWDEYILGEYGESRLSLPRGERIARVIEASNSGMSDRAIASAAGVGRSTVQRDLVSQVAQNGPPAEPRERPGLDGKSYTVQPRPEPTFDSTPDWDPVDYETGEVRAEVQNTTAPHPEPKEDPEPTKPRRRPITDQFFDTAYDFRKNAERLEKLVADDRFPKNKEQIALSHKNDLLRLAETLQHVLRELD